MKAVAATVTTGHLDFATFDSDLATAVGATELPKHNAVIFQANSGDFAGSTLLVVEANGVAGYQAGLDYVMEFAAGSNPNAIAVGFFI